MSKMITLAIVLDQQMARHLGSTACRSLLSDQTHRFEVMAIDGQEDASHDDLEPLTAQPFDGGTMTWCGALSDALLLRAFEQACGFRTAVLWDLVAAETELPYGGDADGYVVLSTQQFDSG